ncbi:MAG: DUF2119 domain-containing protein [Methanobrevibacter sp.]|uniref:DUF2119 domain-containing protein n=1 Tax=Methanobrevibacter sp. TaxID=66852 RepID=UPI0025E35742|nr:DUF2119 domain-containing protein [Methanobrevibacter sp.]MBQ6138376.1 DUF2119 domain-containing protein [Methanobrevibacter sp.]
MSYFRYIDNGEGPTKLFIGGVHGDEGKDVLPLIKLLSNDDFSSGQIYIYNFDKTPYISTIHREFYQSEQGKKILDLIDYYKPDFYTELHSYNIKHFKKLTSLERLDNQGIPPLIDCGQYVLCSSVSPLIRRNHFTKENICQTLEFPSFRGEDLKLSDDELFEKYDYDYSLSVKEYLSFLRLITLSKNRNDFEKRVLKDYKKQADLALKYVKIIYGLDFPRY